MFFCLCFNVRWWLLWGHQLIIWLWLKTHLNSIFNVIISNLFLDIIAVSVVIINWTHCSQKILVIINKPNCLFKVVFAWLKSFENIFVSLSSHWNKIMRKKYREYNYFQDLIVHMWSDLLQNINSETWSTSVYIQTRVLTKIRRVIHTSVWHLSAIYKAEFS